MKPTVGRIVHYRSGGRPLAAIITHVWSDVTVELHVFDPTDGSTFPAHSVPFDPAEFPAQWTWQWPVRA